MTAAAPALDFAVVERFAPEDRGELVELLREPAPDAPRLRLCGSCRTQHAVPAPDAPVALLTLERFARITRFEPGDMTCSVEAGVPVAELAEVLAAERLRLPAPAFGGTIGGALAGGDGPPWSPGAPALRSVLLGLAGVTGDGIAFKAGARVVKNVAGFDVPKLFVGSRGRLFAATELHLKLRPLPEHSAGFAVRDLERHEAFARFDRIRRGGPPPAWLALLRSAAGAFELRGSFEGRTAAVRAALEGHGLTGVGDGGAPPRARRRADRETACGQLRPSRCADWSARLPDDLELCVGGGGGFSATGSAAAIDRVLAETAAAGGRAGILHGPPARRGAAVPCDPVVQALERRVRRAFDPEGRFA